MIPLVVVVADEVLERGVGASIVPERALGAYLSERLVSAVRVRRQNDLDKDRSSLRDSFGF